MLFPCCAEHGSGNRENPERKLQHRLSESEKGEAQIQAVERQKN
jgi:hypothetical protein